MLSRAWNFPCTRLPKQRAPPSPASPPDRTPPETQPRSRELDSSGKRGLGRGSVTLRSPTGRQGSGHTTTLTRSKRYKPTAKTGWSALVLINI